jgi:DNA polymerase
MNALVLDFETYYDKAYSLRRLTIAEYVHDARFHAHGLAIRYPDGGTEFRPDVVAALQELQVAYGTSLERITVVVHNAYFDLYVLRHRFGISVRHFVDTRMLAYQVHGRKTAESGADASLKGLATRYGLHEKGGLDFMCGVRNPDARQLADLSSYARNDVELTHGLAERLLPQVSRPEVEIPLMMHTVRLFTERSIAIDTDRIDSIANQVHAETEKWLHTAEVTAESVSMNGSFNKLMTDALSRSGRLLPMKSGKNGLIPATAKKDQAMLALLGDDDPVVAALAHARTQKKSEDQLIAKLNTLRRIVTATGGTIPIYLTYYGAHTGRFAGGQRFNLQNLGRSGFGLELRRLLIPHAGRHFVAGDLAQIEARVLAYLAGEAELLTAFSTGRDIYSEFASQVLMMEVRKPASADSTEVKSRLTALRQVGKTSVLGLGFSMGPLKFMNSLRSDPSTAPLFGTGVLSPLVCKDIVSAYRSRFDRIAGFWHSLEEAFRRALNGGTVEVGLLQFSARDATVLIRLPSGRLLRYGGARLAGATRTIKYLDKSGQEAEFTPEGDSIFYGNSTALYGGKICENVVQSVARDILIETILRLEAIGIPVLFHCHDEIVLEVKPEDAERVAAILKNELSTSPVWAPRLPVAAEVNVLDRYDK